VRVSANSSGTVRNCRFLAPAAAFSSNMIVLNPGSLTIDGCTFTDIKSYCEEGGVLRMYSGSNLTIKNSSFVRCESGTNCNRVGGVIRGNGTTNITIEDTTFDSCKSINERGGVVFVDGGPSTFTIRRSTFTNCSAPGSRGGVVWCQGLSDVQIEDSRFVGNAALDTGGVYFENPRKFWVDRSEFRSNVGRVGAAIRLNNLGSAGGPYDVAIRTSVFSLNDANYAGEYPAGDIWNDSRSGDGSVVMSRCLLSKSRGNCWYNNCGASTDANSTRWNAPATITDCVWEYSRGDSGVELLMLAGGTVRNSTFAYGGRWPVRYASLVENCIFWGWNLGSNNPNLEGAAPTYSCIELVAQQNLPGSNNIRLYPQFINPAQGDFTLLPTSPCRNAGNPASPNDPDGSVADMGARYWAGLTDCNNNLVPDSQEAFLGDCDFDQVLDVCELAANPSQDCDADGVLDGCELAAGTEPDCNGNQILDRCEVDCNGNGIQDTCDISSGHSLDLNQDGIPDECKPDCNNNNIPDFIELFYHQVPDCNANTIPDGCELASGAVTDCNTNSIPDGCDIAGAPTLDCDHNQIIDSCELAMRDCNANGVVDACDVAAGTSQDLNHDGHPDECKPDCNGNNFPDYIDIAFGVSLDCNQNQVPDECDIPLDATLDCNQNGSIDTCEVATGGAPDCNQNQRPDSCDLATMDCNGNAQVDSCELAAGTAPDCNTNGVIDSCDLAAGTAFDCNSDGIPDSCTGGIPGVDCDNNGNPDTCDLQLGAADCNNNSVLDTCELASQTVPDCNGNHVPDSCDIASGVAPDCDGDGVPSVCELAAGTEQDCNGNSRPDNCDIAVQFSADVNQNAIPDECECSTNNFCVPLPNSTGQPALIELVGPASLSVNAATLRCTQLPPTTAGLFFFGNNGLNPGNPFGNGRLCVTGGIRRLPLIQAQAGVVNQPQDFTGAAYAGIQSGDVRFFQFWYRNTAAGGAGFNLSDGLRVTFCP
jgi:hypothetical protein